ARGPASLPSVVAPGALRAGARPARSGVGDLPREHPAGRGAVARDARPGRLRVTALARRAGGVGASRRDWKEVAAFAARSFPKIGIGFGDAHCAVAYAAAGEREALERWIAEMRIADAEGRLAS